MKKTAKEPGLPRAHEASNDGYHISLFHRARLQGMIDDLLSPLISDHLERIIWCGGERQREREKVEQIYSGNMPICCDITYIYIYIYLCHLVWVDQKHRHALY